MATSGSFRYTMWSVFHGMNGVGTTYTNEAIFTWSVTSTISGPNPQSTISWTMTPEGRIDNMGAREYDMFVKIDGVQVGTGQFKFTNKISGSASGAFSGVTTLSHNANGVKSFTVEIGTTSYTGSSRSQSFTLDTLAVPATLTAAPNFTDEGDPMIYYSNVSGNLVTAVDACISFTGAKDDVPYRAVTKTGTTYRFYLTAEERKTLRKGVTTGNNTSVRFYLRTTIDGKQYYSSMTKQLTLVNYMPTLNPMFYDDNAATVALTGDDTIMIRYFSHVYFNMGAVAKKEATIDSRYVVCGSTTLEDYTSNIGTIVGPDSNIVHFGMTDSRGYSVKETTNFNMIPYEKLTSYLTLQPLSLAGDLVIQFEGKFFNEDFGEERNSLQFEYGIRRNGGDISWHPINPSVTYNGYRYQASYTITGLDPNSTYTITGNVIDALMSIQTEEQSVTSKPIFDWGKSDFQHNTDVYLTANHPIRVNDNGIKKDVFNPQNTEGHTTVGYGNYINERGDTKIYGDSIDLTANSEIRLNGKPFGGKVLWEGASHMNASQVANLSENISDQINGIVLVFSLYRNGYAEDVSIQSFFVSKKEVELLPDAPHAFFLMINAGFSTIGAKYLYIDDDVITGNATNTSNSSNNGLTFNNSMFVLRYVIGV